MMAAGASEGTDEPVGAVLARLRHERRMTGAQLAEVVGMSQPKISRIERGKGVVDPEDVAAIARALGADEAVVVNLMERSERAQDRMTDWRATPVTLAGQQSLAAKWESSAHEVRDFQPTLVAGLLQTSGYAQATLASFQSLTDPGSPDHADAAVLAAVSARIRRQEVLADLSRSFTFVVLEAALRSYLCPPEQMLAQLGHLRNVGQAYANITIKLIPEGTALNFAPMHGFTLFGDDMVTIDAFNTGLTTKGRRDVSQYRRLFEHFEARATTEIEPVLRRCESLCLEAIGRSRPVSDR